MSLRKHRAPCGVLGTSRVFLLGISVLWVAVCSTGAQAPPASPTNLQKGPSSLPAGSVETVTDAERSALTFVAYDLDLHITPGDARMSALARVTVRNDGAEPLKKIALQVSSSLRWESVSARQAGTSAKLTFGQHPVDTDADHTGSVNEAVITLPKPLAPKAEVELMGIYSGETRRSSERLDRIGVSSSQSTETDWDQIGQKGTFLRGFGDVIWYPVSTPPVFLGDGRRFFELAGQQKLRQSGANVRLRLTVEYKGEAPDAAYFCGRRQPLAATSEDRNAPVAEAPGIATAEFATARLGFRFPTLFITDEKVVSSSSDLVSAVTANPDALKGYAEAAEALRPLLVDWLGPKPANILTILDHPGQPFEDGALLIAPLRSAPAESLEPHLIHSLAHAWFPSSQAWVQEGVAEFMTLLWMERTKGRPAALEELDGQARTLALAESQGTTADGPPIDRPGLAAASDEVYFRGKSAAVLWMLRGVAGDDALKRALAHYRLNPTLDADPKGLERSLEQVTGKDYSWFFADWVDRDRGLPDLQIVNAAPRELETKGGKAQGWLVAVDVRNDGGAVAEVPVTVRAGTLTSTERLRVPARSSASTRIVFQGAPKEIQVNDGSVSEVGASVHRRQVGGG